MDRRGAHLLELKKLLVRFEALPGGVKLLVRGGERVEEGLLLRQLRRKSGVLPRQLGRWRAEMSSPRA